MPGKIMDRKETLIINPGFDRAKTLAGGKGLELFDAVFVRILGMDGFTLPEPE